MIDFAGQCSYYSSHQIFLSPRAFFILVLNMKKKLLEKVGKEVCSQKGSIYEGWTHKDYLTFWTKSIHQYSSEKAPVILVGTHAEKKTKEEKEKFFREIWTSLETKDASLQNHFDRKRMFAVGFHENECIEKIKLSVVDVVQNLDHWGEKLPYSWAIFEKFFQEKKNLKIINRETLLAFNEALPQELKLEKDEDIKTMLQFFHDIREILHFDQESLREIIILDVQWFADAFKNVITDKNHAAEDLFKLASQWDKFNESGELSDTLLSAIWEMNNNGYLEHKDDIMLYMEKLGLLAKMEDNNWYVPCMNKKSFPAECFSSYPASSILCYVFDALPAGIFQRLVAICMQIPWKLNSSRDELCIYQTVAVFRFENHNILIGMTPTEIQLQMFVIEGEVDKSTCQQIKNKIDNILNILSETFHADSKFVFAFKCKATGFCDNKESSVINESEFIKPTFQCPYCPIGRKHTIKSKDITKYWIQVNDDEAEPSEDKGISKSSLSESSGSNNFAKILKLLQVGTEAVRICFDKFFPKEDLEKTLKENETDMRRGQFRFLQPQLEILFPKQGGSNTSVSSLSMDVTIMYKLLRNFSDIAPQEMDGEKNLE
ncbi:probable serine/threonine-protein kinase pats1 isoform X2 [Saccostrea cucullata]|uniref:probable serine/threonine-protein kinase pats1 isoform X2 n=1 Tax=Saccostrea cuccullata TaxID=36930 RepID=UPI002ED34921